MAQKEFEPGGGSTMPEGITAAALAKVPLALVLTNPHLDDNPIVYANRAFERITGYSAEMIIGRNCRFLQGEGTDPRHAREIGEALKAERDISIDIINHRADGTKFLNRLMITPLYNENEELQCFLGVQRDMSEGRDSSVSREDADAGERLDVALGEIQHRVKNHLSMIIGMVRMQSRVKTSSDAFNALARRIESLQLLYQEMTEAGVASSRSRRVPLGAYVSRIASTIGHLDGRNSVRVNIDCDAIEVDVEKAARVGLLFSELITNALKHAFVDRDEGLVEARLKMLSAGVIRMTVVDDGVGLPQGREWLADPRSGGAPGGLVTGPDERNIAREIADSISDDPKSVLHTRAETAPKRDGQSGGLGKRIIMSLVQGLDAKIDVNTSTVGTTVTVDIPAED